MTSTSRQSIATLAADLQEVLAWGAAAEAANAAVCAERDAAVAQCVALNERINNQIDTLQSLDATIAAKDSQLEIANATIDDLVRQRNEAREDAVESGLLVTQLNRDVVAANAEIARLTALLNPPHVLKWGDATRAQFLGFPESYPGCYESEFWPSSVAKEQRPTTPIQRAFVSATTMPKWRARYPNANHWFADIELFHKKASGDDYALTADEVAKMLPAFQGARDFADAEGRGLQLSAYSIPRRFGVHETDEEVMAQAEICRPILDLLDECLLTLYPVYEDLDKSRVYIRRNIELGRRIMPGKRVIVLGWDTWHPAVGAPLDGTPVSREWQRMFLEELYAAKVDVYAPWLMAAAPKPTNEPWWLETEAFKAQLSAGMVGPQ
jgi:hypothetical protein